MTRLTYQEMARRRWTQTDEDRFLSYVLQDTNGCWLWQGVLQIAGYGRFTVRHARISAARWAYEHWIAAVPEGHEMCHICDVRVCVNPTHLFTGTRADNMQDASRKGRIRKGASAPSAKLTETAVRAILAEPNRWGVNTRLGRQHGVSPSLIGLIRRGVRWAHLQEKAEALP